MKVGMTKTKVEDHGDERRTELSFAEVATENRIEDAKKTA